MDRICPECGDELPESGVPLRECRACAGFVTPLGTTSVPLVEPIGDEFRAGPAIELPPNIVGRFQVGRLLGAGGMATVYHAHDRQMHAEVAIKILSRPFDPAFRARFEREGRLLMQLNHPNVVHLLEMENSDSCSCLVMEYVDGGTLRRRLTGAQTNVSAAVTIALDLLSGLEAVHANGIVHRDLKPENILITSTGQAKLSDLGIAKPFDRMTQELTATGHLIGTPRYMSPEQLLGGEVAARSDLYSVGLILYELLAGNPPTPPGLVELVQFHQAYARVKCLGRFGSDVPDALARLIEVTLAPDADDRPPSATELARRLRLATAPMTVSTALPLAQQSDEDLMVASAQGMAEAFSELVRRHTHLAWRIAHSFLSDPHEAEDLAQQSFLKIHLRAAMYRPTASFKAYLRCVVTRLCLDRAAKNVAEPIDQLPAMIDPIPTPGQQMVNKERAGEVRAALRGLPPLQRIACVLRYYDGCGHAQIGEALGITPKAAERLLAHARRRLANTLGEFP